MGDGHLHEVEPTNPSERCQEKRNTASDASDETLPLCTDLRAHGGTLCVRSQRGRCSESPASSHMDRSSPSMPRFWERAECKLRGVTSAPTQHFSTNGRRDCLEAA